MRRAVGGGRVVVVDDVGGLTEGDVMTLVFFCAYPFGGAGSVHVVSEGAVRDGMRETVCGQRLTRETIGRTKVRRVDGRRCCPGCFDAGKRRE